MDAMTLAEVTVSTTFIVFAYLAIGAAALVIFVGLFGPGLRYKISVTNAEDNSSESFVHTLEALTDSKVHHDLDLRVLGQVANDGDVGVVHAVPSSGLDSRCWLVRRVDGLAG